MYLVTRTFFIFIFLFFTFINFKLIFSSNNIYYFILIILLYISITLYYYYQKNLTIKAVINNINFIKFSKNIFISSSLVIKNDIIKKLEAFYISKQPLYIISIDEYSRVENSFLNNSAFSYKDIKLSLITLGNFEEKDISILPLLSHELEHINKNHLYYRKIYNQTFILLTFLIFIFLNDLNIFNILLLATLAFLYTIIKILIIRNQEYSADKASYSLSGKNNTLALLNTISDQSKAFQPHPSVIDRVNKINKLT